MSAKGMDPSRSTPFEELIDTLMRTAIEHAGADRGLLILLGADGQRIEAEATTTGDTIIVRRREAVVGAVPESIVQYVARTQESVILDDVATLNPFSADPYIRERHARSILCLPSIRQGKVVGVLYMENNLTAHAFTPTRIAVLKLLASQAAISLENTRLYTDLEKREARIRRLVDANIIGIVIAKFDGEILDANEAFLRMVGYGREDLLSGRILWPDLTPTEWRDSDAKAVAELSANGVLQPIQKEFFRKDGTRVPVLAGAAMFEESGNEGVTFVLDLSEQKRAEHALRESETRLQAFFENSPSLIFLKDLAGRYLYVNQEFKRAFGVTEEQTKGKRDDELFSAEQAATFQANDRQVLEGGVPIEFEEVTLQEDGLHTSIVHKFPLFNTEGEIYAIGGIATDITQRVQARAELERALAEIKRLKDQLYRENLALREEVDRASMFEEIVGTSTALQAVLDRVAKVAPTDSTVLITGETGTGKELIARAVHKRSHRAGRAFVSVNCAALPPALISSELFGHEKGAFTGATQRRLGRFELADGGTIFLDEVGELPPDTQIALLRVLQERQFERVGGAQPVTVDVRVIAATNRNLKAATSSGSFRLDLFYRLNVFPVEVPPLRERQDDILMLLEYFVQRFATRAGKNIRAIDRKTLELLQSYEWPGNIRELQNVVERSVIVSTGDVFSVDESWLSKDAQQPGPRSDESRPIAKDSRAEREIIEAALVACRGRVAGPKGAAAKLRMPPSTLYSRIKALNIRKSDFKFV